MHEPGEPNFPLDVGFLAARPTHLSAVEAMGQ
jgi:hypothetical protein